MNTAEYPRNGHANSYLGPSWTPSHIQLPPSHFSLSSVITWGCFVHLCPNKRRFKVSLAYVCPVYFSSLDRHLAATTPKLALGTCCVVELTSQHTPEGTENSIGNSEDSTPFSTGLSWRVTQQSSNSVFNSWEWVLFLQYLILGRCKLEIPLNTMSNQDLRNYDDLITVIMLTSPYPSQYITE